jgi:predicted deacetylase
MVGLQLYAGAMARPRILLASIHDVSPRFESEVDRLLALLRPHVRNRLAMLVVPNHWGDAPLIAGSSFGSKLRAWADSGIEMFLHGYFHRDEARHQRQTDRLRARFLTAGEGEFLGLSKREAQARIVDGKTLVEDVIGRQIAGFVAPAWLYGPGARHALEDCAIPLAEDHWRVWSPATGAKLAGGPVITWASRTPLRLASSLSAAKALRRLPLPVLRLGVHPQDVRHPLLVRSIDASLRAALRDRRPGAYLDLLAT